MRYLILILSLSGCTGHAADLSRPPTGEQVFHELLKNGSIHLNNEPLCKANINLFTQLSLALSVSYESDNTAIIKSFCSLTKHEFSGGNIKNAWDCTVQINENNKKGDFISSSTIVFSLTADKKEFIKGSLRCR